MDKMDMDYKKMEEDGIELVGRSLGLWLIDKFLNEIDDERGILLFKVERPDGDLDFNFYTMLEAEKTHDIVKSILSIAGDDYCENYYDLLVYYANNVIREYYQNLCNARDGMDVECPHFYELVERASDDTRIFKCKYCGREFKDSDEIPF
jgi:hypothetical protein